MCRFVVCVRPREGSVRPRLLSPPVGAGQTWMVPVGLFLIPILDVRSLVLLIDFLLFRLFET